MQANNFARPGTKPNEIEICAKCFEPMNSYGKMCPNICIGAQTMIVQQSELAQLREDNRRVCSKCGGEWLPHKTFCGEYCTGAVRIKPPFGLAQTQPPKLSNQQMQ